MRGKIENISIAYKGAILDIEYIYTPEVPETRLDDAEKEDASIESIHHKGVSLLEMLDDYLKEIELIILKTSHE